MKILFVCQYFYPEVFRGNDIAFHWAEQGHDVHVVSGVPNYPHGKFYEGYGLFKKRHEVIRGVKVTHLPIVPRGNGKVTLLLNYLSYLIVANVWVFFHALFHKYDRVFVQQLSPVTMSSPGVLYKRIRKVPLYTWVLDLWPESLTAAGGVTNKYILGFFRHYVKQEYKYSDKILISSRSFAKSIAEYGDYSDKVVYYPQWADGIDGGIIIPDNPPVIPDGFKLMFAGAVGEAHGFECTMQAALMTKDYKDIKWIIVGDGRKLDWVKDYIKEHELEETVYTLGRYPSDTMPWFFNQADVMLVTLNDDPLFKLYAPAKISSYMAAAKPILAVLNGEGVEVIKEAECGWSISSGDSEGLAKLALELSHIDKQILLEKGQNAYNYYIGHYEKERCMNNIDELMGLKPSGKIE